MVIKNYSSGPFKRANISRRHSNIKKKKLTSYLDFYGVLILVNIKRHKILAIDFNIVLCNVHVFVNHFPKYTNKKFLSPFN